MDLQKLKSNSLYKRLAPFFDLSAWILVLVAMIPLFFIDAAMAKTLVQWSAFGLALAGVSVVICRVTLPHVYLKDLIENAWGQGGVGNALIASATIIYMAVIFLGLILWAKA
ncbi:holin [Stenotrophomonas phage Sonora]|nr:holin [Stenotrophomonas phage Sonora]